MRKGDYFERKDGEEEKEDGKRLRQKEDGKRGRMKKESWSSFSYDVLHSSISLS